MVDSEYSAMVIITAQIHAKKPELRFWASPNPAHGLSEIGDGEDGNGPCWK